jgi:hypothetical protein
MPAGTEKIGGIEYNIKLNSSPLKASELNDAPIRDRQRHGRVRARRRHVRDGFGAADQPGAGRRAARRADVGAEDRQRLDAGHHPDRVKRLLPGSATQLPPA